jgi:hypothetical protein
MTQGNRSAYRQVGRVIGGVGLASLAVLVIAGLSSRRSRPVPLRGRVLRSPRLGAVVESDGHLGAREPEYSGDHAGRA